jgi:hypothetical protein
MVKTIKIVICQYLKSHRKKDEESSNYHKIEEKILLFSGWVHKFK